ncbi:MAG: phosphonate C-P lyase system protein PhnG [Rhizobiales bacterium 32-66-8]|nr:MAG: phosphonate C-P lyase system protein PhnG [Rhizobiales bacterium 32-66-8]
MAVLSRATQGELDDALERFEPLPTIHDLRKPEVGLAMVRGRIGGDGSPFNLGETTVTRAAVRVQPCAVGFAYILGHAPERARAAAILDALWQDPALRAAVEDVLTPIRRRLSAARTQSAAKTEATKVNFFTMVRGDD